MSKIIRRIADSGIRRVFTFIPVNLCSSTNRRKNLLRYGLFSATLGLNIPDKRNPTMSTDHIMFAGLEFSAGRKPVTFAALDEELNVKSIQKWGIEEALACLNEYESIWLAVNLSAREPETNQDFERRIAATGFTSYSGKNEAKQLLLTNTQDSFRTLVGHKLLPRRTLEGRLQRSAILYERGLSLTDPMEVFEEITRFKLAQGILPLDNIYSSKELDALVAAYVAWLAATRPGQVVATGEFVLPAPE
jgi:hypothetical protein